MPAKDDVVIFLIGSSLFDHPSKAPLRLGANAANKKPGAISARASCTILSDCAF
jgi:hypothetical protein